MNREIKFRVYDKKLKKYMTLKEYQDLHAIEVETDGTLILSPRYRFMDSMMIDTDAFDVQEFTGLHDKNGKEIYEGDIIHIPEDWEEYGWASGENYEIDFKDGRFRLKPKYKPNATGYDLEFTNELEVIGNIYENPDLLKGADNIE